MVKTFRMRWSRRNRDGPALGVRFELVAIGALVTPDGVRDATGALLAPFQLWTSPDPALIDAPPSGPSTRRSPAPSRTSSRRHRGALPSARS